MSFDTRILWQSTRPHRRCMDDRCARRSLLAIGVCIGLLACVGRLVGRGACSLIGLSVLYVSIVPWIA